MLGVRHLDKVRAVVVFTAFYLGGIFLVADLNAAYILRDAVVGPALVAIFYAVFFTPAFIAAVGVLLFTRASARLRLGLASSFAVSIATGFALLFAAAQSTALADAIKRSDSEVIVAMNAFYAGAFMLVGLLLRRKETRSSSTP